MDIQKYINMVGDIKYDGIVINAKFTESFHNPEREVMYADVVVDAKGRFEEATPIRTSLIESKEETDKLIIVKTMNSTYVAIK